MYKKILILLGILLLFTNFCFADWNSSSDMQVKTGSAAIDQIQDCLKALDASVGTPPTSLMAGTIVLFEGATADAYETSLTITDPTADRTITIPNNTGTVLLDTDTQNQVLSGGSPIVCEGATADAFETIFAITDPTADRTITFPNNTGTVAFAADTEYYIGSFTRDISTASGTQAVTGVGFTPTHIIFSAYTGSAGSGTVFGMSDNTTEQCIYISGATEGLNVATTDCIYLRVSSGNTYAGVTTSLDSDGFTTTWTKTGTTTGTATITFMAFK